MRTEELPREFGKYHLIERIATGGMAELYRAKLYGAGGFEKDLAIKKVLPHLAQDQAFVQMFMDEAMITVTLNHGNIVQVIDFGELEGEYFLVMEFVDGVDLQLLIKRAAEDYEPIPVELAAHVGEQICRGLHYAHEKLGPDGNPLQIVHRDVSPQNVLLSFEGQVKLVDFGIARAASRVTSTQAGIVKGKLAYMSPEQLTGQVVDRRSDVFAAGIILYEMLTNHRPFEGATPHETMALISRGKYQEPQKLNRQVPKKLAKLVARALEVNPKKRLPTAGALANELSNLLHAGGTPPEASALAALVRARCPDARPRSLAPTPNRFHPREPTPQGATPPRGEPPRAPATPAPEPPAPAPAEPPPLAVQAFQPVPRPSSLPAPEPDGSDAVVVVDEAVSFGVLGLPEDYAVSRLAAEERRPTQPGHQPAVPAPLADPELLSAPTRILEPGSAAPTPATAAPEDGFQVPDLSHRTDQELLAAPTVIRPEAPALDLLSAPTRILEAAAPEQKPAPRAEVSDSMRAWMERGPQKAPEFEDEPPEQAGRSPGRSPAPIIAGVLILGALALVAFVFLVWKPFGPGPTPEAGAGDLGSPRAGMGTGAAAGTAAADLEATTTDAGLGVAAADAGGAITELDGGLAIALAPDAGAGVDPTGADSTRPVPPKAVPPKPVPPKPVPPKPVPPKPVPPKPAVAAAKGTGTLRINSEPFAMVYLGPKRLGPTPQMDIKLPAGSHVLTLKNDALGITKKVQVRIEPDKIHTVFVELAK